MTVFIQNDATGAGTGSLDANQGAVDLAIVANGDAGLGLAAAVGTRQQVTYAASDPGDPGDAPRCARQHELQPGLWAGSGAAGRTDRDPPGAGQLRAQRRRPGHDVRRHRASPSNSGLAGAGLNTTTDCLVIYDTSQSNGSGYCTARAGTGGTLDLQTPNPVILYHELSHALRTVTNAMLALTAACNPSSPEEAAAITDENDMRTQLATAAGTTAVLRDTGNHCGGTCPLGPVTGSCCIVASVASGSPLSEEVASLRRVRDGLVRRSEVGFAFFDALHRDYYGFSPQVCTLLARRQELRPLVLEGFVRPLAWILSAIEDLALQNADAAAVGRRFVADHPDRGLAAARLAMLRRARERARRRRRGPAGRPAGAGRARAPTLHSEHLLWGIVEPVRLYGSALELQLRGGDPQQVGEHLRAGIEAWAPSMPLDGIWASLTATEARIELDLLERTLLLSSAASATFRDRLAREYRVTAIDSLVDERTT